MLLALIFEVLRSNYTYFAFVAGGSDVRDFKTEHYDSMTLSDSEKTQVLLSGTDFEVDSVSFSIKAIGNYIYNTDVKILVNDDSTDDGYYVLTSKNIAVTPEERTHTVYLRSAGDADSVIVSFENYEGSFTATDFVVNPEFHFAFNPIRFLFIVFFCLAAYYYKNRTEEKKVSLHIKSRRALALAVGLCVAATAFVAVLNTTGSDNDPINYPLEGPVDNYNPYIQQFDAFQKGQIHLDVEPTEELLELENPYNPNEREGIYYLWDRAFYEGKYYSYFGVTPIITVYLPVYLLTGSLPSDNFVITVYAFIAAVFFALAVMQWYKNSGKNNSPYFAAMCTVFAYLSSLALLIFRGTARFYYIASMAGMAFTAAFAYYMLKAMGEAKDKKRIGYFVLAGISFAFAFHSRVNSVLPFAITVIVFVTRHVVLRIKEKKTGLCLAELSALGIPVAAGVAASLIYNHIRFGSPFDFGTAYQLTVADTSLYKVSLRGLIPSIFHYFIHPFAFTKSFPFIGFNYINLGDYGSITYVDSGLGIFAMPFILMLIASVVIFRSRRVCNGRKALLATALTSLLITAFFDFCMGGIIFRYTADISLYAAFLAAVIALDCGEIISEKYGSGANRVYAYGVSSLGTLSALVAAGAAIFPSGNLVDSSPVVFETIRELLVFWN